MRKVYNFKFAIDNNTRKFMRFLKEHDAYFSYINNVINDQYNNFTPSKHKPLNYILKAFYWRDTKEGRKYWQILNHLWMRVYCKATLDECKMCVTDSEILDFNLEELVKQEQEKIFNKI